MMKPTTSTILLAASMCCAGASLAAPRIIDESCVASGCFPGDRPGLPVEIDQPGSYRFASNLSLGHGDPRGVVILASNVHIDLDGFSITGRNRCEWTGESTECELTRWGAAVESIDGADAVSVVNGSIRGIEGAGVVLAGQGSRVRDLTVLEVSSDGIVVEGAGTVEGCTVDRAARTAIYAPTVGGPVLISRSTASRSTRAFNAGTLDNVAARFNGQGITGLSGVVDGSEDESRVVLP